MASPEWAVVLEGLEAPAACPGADVGCQGKGFQLDAISVEYCVFVARLCGCAQSNAQIFILQIQLKDR